MKIVFMGTTEFAAASLKALVESNQYEIVAVVTQPDRPKGRGHKVMMSAVKEYALTQGLPVLQPERVKTPGFQEEMEKLQPEGSSCPKACWICPDSAASTSMLPCCPDTGERLPSIMPS